MTLLLARRSSPSPLAARSAPRWPRVALALALALLPLPACDYTRHPEIPCTPLTLLGPIEAPCPEGMTAVPGGALSVRHAKHPKGENPPIFAPFCLDRAEVTVNLYLACVTSGACDREHLEDASPDGVTFVREASCNARHPGQPDQPDHPINCVNFAQAERYCNARGARLPTEEEWEWAAQGGTCPSDSYGRDQWLWEKAKGPRALCTIDQQTVDGTCAIGANPTGDSPPGIHDLIGNVWEWTASNWGTSPKRVIRGGSWMSRGATPWYRAGYPPEARQSDLGFRCAADLRGATPAP